VVIRFICGDISSHFLRASAVNHKKPEAGTF